MMPTIQLRDYCGAVEARREAEAARRRRWERRARKAEVAFAVVCFLPLPCVVLYGLWGALRFVLGL